MTFEAFKKGSHSFAEVKEWADETIDTVENTEKGWGNEGLRIIHSKMNKLLVVVKFDLRPTAIKSDSSVDLEHDEELGDSNEDMSDEEVANSDTPEAPVRKTEAKVDVAPTDAVLDLQYFFPLCDQALMENRKRQIILVIACGGDDVFRVHRYLGLQAEIKKRLGIFIAVTDGVELSDEVSLRPVGYDEGNIRALLPLLCIGEGKYVTCSEEKDDALKYVLTVKELAANSGDLSGYIRDYLQGKHTTEENADDEKKKSEKDRIQYNALVRAGRSFVNAINRKIMGRPTKPETIAARMKKIQAFWDIVLSPECGLQRHSLLTQIIWLDILYSLNRQDVLSFDERSGTYSNSQFYFALWDAVAYGEGILQLLENSELHSQHHIGYLSVYAHNVGIERVSEITIVAERRTRIYKKYRLNLGDSIVGPDENCYLEFNVTDMGRDATGNAKGIEVTSERQLTDLFTGLDARSENDVIHHYGLPLFYRTVMRKNGRFVCRTPLDNKLSVQFLAGHMQGKKSQQAPSRECVETGQVWTSYQILLPVTFQQVPIESVKTSHQRLFDSSFLSRLPLPCDYKQKMIERTSFFPETQSNLLKTAAGKIRLAQTIGNKLYELIGSQEFEKTVFEMDVRKLSTAAFDVYIKGLFHCIAQMARVLDNKNKYQPCLLFRLVFTDVFAISEALRRFSIFYDSLGENTWMKHVQIALCEESEDGNSNVRLILAGTNIHQAYITAKQWMYYNVDLDSGFLLSQVEYLVSYRKSKTSAVRCVPLFPFDLVKDVTGKSDFSRKLDIQLDRDFQSKDCGCKIEKAHIRLGSKIHIEDFYDAELLFQSVANIYRFAYLLAGDIFQKLSSEDNKGISNLFLIGYENYSSLLVDEVKCLLEEALPNNKKLGAININHVQYVKKTNGVETIVPEREMLNAGGEHDACIIILPIGTTLSTIYKIKNVFYRKCGGSYQPKLLGGYALILVGDSSDPRISDEYWTVDQKCQDQVILKPENKTDDSDNKIKVSWLFLRQTRWMRPERCELCGGSTIADLLTHIPLCQVDKTSTMPELIYPLRNSNMNHGIGFTVEDHNHEIEPLREMKGCIEYGHIHREANHYLFYINYEEYYNKVRKPCITWLDTVRDKIDENEFNIIISPLQYESNLFLKDVVDHVFQHCLRFLYLPLDQVYREEIRSRFSYIAKEYQDVCKNGNAPKYNVYYVDYSIVSGQTMSRSESLLQMLMNDASEGVSIQIYRKVILLTNRSSFDTAAVYVANPRDDFIAFSTLRIPSYNTLGNKCPACEMVDMYKRVAKQSATNELYWHFMSLAEKHKLCTPEEHVEMQRNRQFSSPRYLQQFCQMLYLEDGGSNKSKDKQKPVADVLASCLDKLAGSYDCSQLTLNDIFEKADDGKEVLELYYQDLVAERNWRRMICTHDVMVIFEELSGSDWKDETVRSKLWSEVVKDVMHTHDADSKTSDNVRREWLISYIKACSRGYPARFAPIRKAAYTLLELLFRELLHQNKKYDEASRDAYDVEHSALDGIWEQVIGKDESSQFRELLKLKKNAGLAEVIQFYQLYQVLAKRLSDMRSNLLLQHDVLKDTVCYYQVLKQQHDVAKKALETGTQYERLSKLLLFPSDMQLQSDYLHLVKWTAMGSKDGAKSVLLQKLAQDIYKECRASEKEKEEQQILNTEEFAQLICTENTRVLYSGVERLDERISRSAALEISVAEEIEKCIIDKAKASDSHENDDPSEQNEIKHEYLAQNPMRDLLRFIDMDFALGFKTVPDLHQKLLTPLLGFYRQIMDMHSDEVFAKRRNYVERYNLLCYYLAKISGYENCCMVHRSNNINQIIAKCVSTADIDKLEENIDVILGKTVVGYSQTNYSQQEDMNLGNTIIAPEKSEEDGIVIALRISRHPQVKFLQTIYIILLKEDKNARLLTNQPTDMVTGEQINDADKDQRYKKALLDARDIRSHYLLFMRQRLQTLLERDLYALHHFRSGLEDVQRIYQNEPLCILHLTDLHISAQNQSAIKLLLKSKQDELKKDDPELMVITGDVVQGDSVAVDLEANYRYAAEIITEIAKILWSEKSEDGKYILRNDWKKRIVIIPGNHDYASMNELSAIHSLRVTTGGAPAARNGTPMSKFAYYIQFLQDLLDIDSSQSIRTNLNSILEYPDLQLRIIALNSISEVGPMRNNKMQLDKAFVEQVAQRPRSTEANDRYYSLCLAHHTRCYAPDYFADRYYEKGMSDNIIAYAKRIMECCLDGRNALMGVSASERKETIDTVLAELKSIQGNDPTSVKVFQADHQGTALYSDVDYIISHWFELTDERSAQILSDYKRNKIMADADLRAYHERLQMLESSLGSFFMLGGHTHRPGQTKTWGDKACVEGARFYAEREDKTTLNFGRLLIGMKDGKKQPNYVFSGKTAIQTLEDKEPSM